MKPEIRFGLSRAEYEGLPGDRFSRLKLIAKSPAHFKHGAEEEQEDTDALKFGRCAHLAILEPEEFQRGVVIWDGGTRRGKEWDAFREKHAGKEILTESESESLQGIRAAIQRADYARPYLVYGQSEVTLLWGAEVVPGHVMPVKGRLDYLTESAIVDLKFVRCASPAAFGRQAWDLSYLAQGAFYADGYERATGRRLPFAFVAIEKTPPYCVGVYIMTEEQHAAGRAEYERWLATLSLCRLEDRWPGYVTGPTPLVLPPWAEKQAQELFTAGFAEGAAQ
jgi:hypothetical protein